MDRKRLDEIIALKESQKSKKGKSIKDLSPKEKDELFEVVCKILGLI